jgi:hypothetical protein
MSSRDALNPPSPSEGQEHDPEGARKSLEDARELSDKEQHNRKRSETGDIIGGS